MADDDKLLAIRTRIDQIDAQLQQLISERAECAQQVARIKNISADSSDYYRAEREAEVLRTVMERNNGPLTDEEMVRLFQEIMSACLALQHPMKIAFLGPEGTFTHAAAHAHFGKSVSTVPLSAIDEVFREVESGAAHYGVVPVENSTEGIVNYTLDMFVQSPLKICSEVELRIHHHLMSSVGDLQQVKTVYAHQQALAQCREWLDRNMPGVDCVAVSSNAEAARKAGEQQDAAAIASEAAADIYQLGILARNIEDHPDNATRFLVIGRKTPGRCGNDKTSLLLMAANKPGALQALLKPFADNDISLTRVESRPSHSGTWDYVFFVDIEGCSEDENVACALQELHEVASMIKILGSYPKAVIQA